MTTINAYATRADLLQVLMQAEDSAQPNVIDDAVIDDMLTDASRAVDNFCGRQFYAAAQTLQLDVPADRQLYFGVDVLAVTGASDGTGASIASGNYYLWPRGAVAYNSIVLTEAASAGWYGASSGNTEGVITIAASVGYCNRAASAASDPAKNLKVIAATHRATLIKAQIMYQQRHPSSVESRVLKDADWQALLEGYVRGAY
jgi:hypothetical protein